jgi:hypothetical protein
MQYNCPVFCSGARMTKTFLLAATLALLVQSIGPTASLCETKAKDFCTRKLHVIMRNPESLRGRAKIAYKIAIAHPYLLQHLFCWDGGDLTDDHECLLDSFTTDYAVDDTISQDEAILAEKLWQQKLPLAEIQKRIDMKFHGMHPFEDTTQVKRYKAARMYK